MELWNKTSHDLVVQMFCVWKGKILESLSEVNAPLTHNVVRSDFLCLRAMGGASYNYVVGVGIAIGEISHMQMI